MPSLRGVFLPDRVLLDFAGLLADIGPECEGQAVPARVCKSFEGELQESSPETHGGVNFFGTERSLLSFQTAGSETHEVRRPARTSVGCEFTAIVASELCLQPPLDVRPVLLSRGLGFWAPLNRNPRSNCTP